MCQASGMSKRNPNNCLYARNVTSDFKTTRFLFLTKQPNSLWPLSFILSPVKLWTVTGYRVALYRFPLDIRCRSHLNPNTKQTKIKISFSSTLALSFAGCFLNPLITFKLEVALWVPTLRSVGVPLHAEWPACPEADGSQSVSTDTHSSSVWGRGSWNCSLEEMLVVKLLAAIWTTRLAEATALQKHKILPILV